MRDHEGDVRGFYIANRAYYGGHTSDRKEITFGLYSPLGGTSGEMGVQWQELNGKSVPQLRAFDDSWSALATFGDLLSELAKVGDECITEDQLIEILLSCSFEDSTPYTDPNEIAGLIRKLESLQGEITAVEARLAELVPTY